MADIGQAIAWLQDDQKIRREVWKEGTYLSLDWRGDVKQSSCNKGTKRIETQINLWATEGILAHDWEIYSQPRWKVGDTAYLPIRITDISRNGVRVTGAGEPIWMEKTAVLSAEEIKEQL